jgi:hypothetical protein
MATVIMVVWQLGRQWLWRTTDGGSSGSGGGGVGCSVSCGVGCGFHGIGGGGECHDDGGMEEVVTWRLFLFMIFVANLQVPVNRAEGSTGTHQ